MLDPRRTRIAGMTTLGAILLAAAVMKGCSSGPKRPEPPPKSSPPAMAKGDTTTSEPGDAPADAPSDEGMEVANVPAPAPEPAPEPMPEPEPAPMPETAPAAPAMPSMDGAPPKPPVNVPPPPPPTEPLEGEPGAAPVMPEPKPEPKPMPKPEPKPGPDMPGPDMPGPDMVDVKPEPKPEPGPVDVTPEPKPEPGSVTVEDAPSMKSEEDLLLESLSEEKRIELEKRRYLAQKYLDLGEAAYKEFNYDEAEQFALKSLDQRGANPDAHDLLNRARVALGKRTGDIGATADMLAQERRIKMQQAESSAKGHYDQGRTRMGEGDWTGAVRAFESTLNVIETTPYDIDWGDLRSNATGRLAEARTARDRAAEEARRRAAEEAYKAVKEQELQRQLAEEEKYRALMGEAFRSYDEDQFAKAENLAQQALDLRPTNSRARDLLKAANRARHGQTVEATKRDEKEKFRRWKLDMLESTIPYSDIVTGPSREFWDRITRLRAGGSVDTATLTESPEASAVRNRLNEETTSFEFDGQTLSEAIQYLSARHNINLVIDEQVRADADAQPLPPFKLSNHPLGEALNLLLNNVAGLTYRVRGNLVFITRAELAREDPVVRIHPVGDLTMKLNNFVAPNLILKPAGAEADENSPQFGADVEGTSAYGAAEDLVTLIRDNVGETPDVWDADGVAMDAQGESNILVVAEPALQAAVDNFLNDLRKFSGLVVNIESRFLTVSDNFLRDVGVDIRGLGGQTGANVVLDDVTNGLEDGASGGLDNGGVGVPGNASGKPSSGAFFNDNSDGDYRGRTEQIFDRSLASTLSNTGGAVLQWTLLDDTQLSIIWRAVQKRQEARVLQSPNLTVFNTQRANITLINQLAFVQDFDVEVAQTAFIADPIVSIIQDGLALDVKPVVSNDRRYVTLQLQPTIATLQRPIQTFTTSLGAFTTPVTLQLPQITIQKAQTTVRVPNGGTLLLGGLKNLQMVDMSSETPWLSKIPIVSFFFSRRGSAQEFNNLLIIIKARIADMGAEDDFIGR